MRSVGWCVLATLVCLSPSCTLDRFPQRQSTEREITLARQGTGAVTGDTPGLLPGTDLTPEDAGNPPSEPSSVGGLSCADTECPFVPSPIEQCCTGDADIEAGAARAVDRCGLYLGKTSSPTAGESCWQRDQLGILDSECPSVLSLGGEVEQGCCSPDGRCGTWNVNQAIGCHYNEGVDQECGEEEIEDAVECEATGVFAIRVDVDVTWGGRTGGLAALTDDGRGLITVHMMARIDELDEDNVITSGSVQACGIALPAFYSSTLCESYASYFPARIFDSPELPEWPMIGSFSCLHPGCLFNFEAQTQLLGIELESGEAPWPTPVETAELGCPSGRGEACFPDHDDDGYPGLTVELLTSGTAPPGVACGGVYQQRGAPLSESIAAIFDGVRRTDRIFLGTRAKLGGASRIGEDCESGIGAGIAEFVQSRAWGCLAEPGTANIPYPPAGDNEPCAAVEAQFMDQNLPIYHVLGAGEEPDPQLVLVDYERSLGPIATVERIADAGASVSCGEIREALD